MNMLKRGTQIAAAHCLPRAAVSSLERRFLGWEPPVCLATIAMGMIDLRIFEWESWGYLIPPAVAIEILSRLMHMCRQDCGRQK